MPNPETKVIIVSSDAMDTRFPESPLEIAETKRTKKLLENLGYNFHETLRRSRDEEPSSVDDLHAMASLLHADWQHARTQGNKEQAVAVARLFNLVTKTARDLQETLHPFDDTPIIELARGITENLEKEKISGTFDPDHMAEVLYETARSLKHWDTWPERLLPSRVNQPYTAKTVTSVSGKSYELPDSWITFVTACDSGMFAHMHGLSVSFAAPNGNNNALINQTWQLYSETEVFPVKLARSDRYDEHTVISIPPRWMHSIRPARKEEAYYPSLEEMADTPGLVLDVIHHADFGLRSSTHVYRPVREMVEHMSNIPYEGVWNTMGMLAINFTTKELFLGDLHAMEQRMARWRNGDCASCSACITIRVEQEKRQTVPLHSVRPLIHTLTDTDTIPIWRFNEPPHSSLR